MLVSLTVGKVDAGVAVLLTEDNRLIEFPSVLLPKNITSGSIVDITVSRNLAAEAASVAAFQSLQNRILNTYGIHSPSPPVLRLRNATQTSLVLEWDPINLATASLKSLALYRNGSKAGSIPRPMETLSTKISGLAIDTEYTFHLVLRTSAGTFQSEKLVCRTHKMTDLSGITVTPGVLPPDLRKSLANAVDRIGAKLIDTVRIDTTHFVCTEGRGSAWEKAVEMNIPVVRPEWVEGCEREGTIVSVRGYYLNADPKMRQIGPGIGAQRRQQGLSNISGPVSGGKQQRINTDSGVPEGNREQPTTSLPASVSRGPSSGTGSEDSHLKSPPTPPPKDAKPGSTARSPHGHNAERLGSGDDDGSEEEDQDADAHEDEEDDASESETDGADRSMEGGPISSRSVSSRHKQNNVSQLRSLSPESASSGDRRTNGTGREEGELDEVPL